MMPTTFYEVRSRDGTLAAIHKRVDRPDGGKNVIWLRPEGAVGLNGTPTSELPLFGIDRIGDDDQVVIVEGEKAALALQGLGIAAVGTVTGAAGTPGATALADLAGRSKRQRGRPFDPAAASWPRDSRSPQSVSRQRRSPTAPARSRTFSANRPRADEH